ncbi:phosphopantetheine-binding protein [Rhodobacter xanthinilyticus]|uniref:Phosphopantetheine-binding protein n=1 Tax=Rhodobacter xanthinilyticus TaxID=1850250 RepID=A0A1D9MC69_9RHOB|nr:acyl carrier protein [Rhodobacter xanthinilyticus]AOZ69398.1 phosphopantetheine-binding protein [Rhodobacter xanthinilyticus]
MRADVQDQIISILAREAVMDPADVHPEMSLDELGLDSLGLVEVIFAIEETFDIAVPFNANEPSQSEFDISSVGAIVRAVERLLGGLAPAPAAA